MKKISSIPLQIEHLVYVIHGQRVMLDSDLAMIYGVLTKVLNQAVKRNVDRFPEDFMFQLTKTEWEFLSSQDATLNLRSQNVTSKRICKITILIKIYI
ncbi:MAG TPA: ORF6N domain-containing protein [Ignavibacteria bacterium]